LRNWQESDVDHYLVLAGDVGYNCFSPPGRFLVRTAEEARAKVLERMLLFNERRLGKFPIFLRATGEFIGTCGMEPFDLATV
jgi:RimJ/RimL family protein N-acetyltransferase